MSTVSIHIEGHEDGSIDDYMDLAVVLRHIADRMMDGDAGIRDNEIPTSILPPPVDSEGDVYEDPATWSVQWSRY